MNRTILTIAAAALSASTFFGSAAQACISCEYVPEVVHTPVGGKSFAAKRVEKKRVYIAAKELPARAAVKKQSIPKAEPVAKKVDIAPKKLETAKAAPVETVSEPKSISTATLLETGKIKSEPAAAPVETEKKVADLGCKKFIPTAGVTVSVPCE